jgi:crossover junction endodeoxyribonuclease RuvC
MKVIIGIDPGKDGALVALNLEGEHVVTHLTKQDFTLPIGKGSKREYDVGSMAKTILELHTTYGVALVVIEKQHSMPLQGVASTFSTGMGYGMWLGIVGAFGIPLQVVGARAWQKRVLLGVPGEGKGRAVLLAKQRFPGVDLTPGKKRKPHDGIADAVCIAAYGLISGGHWG